MRALGLVTTPHTHREFYARTLAELIGHGHRRVLISGSADINMLEQVYAAFDVAGAAPGITFVDRCPTPVALAEWYATRTKRAVTATASDILDYEDEPFDLICTHSFMGYFTDEGRKALARKWASLLRPGGKVVTINRIRPGASGVVCFTPKQARLFALRAQEAASAQGLDAPAIFKAAARYAERFRIRPVGSLANLRAVFEENGFAIDHIASDPDDGQRFLPETAPTTPDGAHYVRIIATRDAR